MNLEKIDKVRYEKYNNLFSDLLNQNEQSLNQFFSFSSSRKYDAYNPKDQNFNQYYSFVFSGCSETHGDWISKPTVPYGDYSKIWGFQVADKLNLSTPLNLGMGGFSAHAIVKDLVHHCITNGNPKVIFILFPDLGRYPHVVNKKIKHKDISNTHDYIQHFYMTYKDEEDFTKISKVPHEATDVLSFKQSIYINLQSIIFFEQFCKSNNIYFKYSSWDYLANKILVDAQKKYPDLYTGYVKSDFENWDTWPFWINPEMNCHEDLKNDIHKNIFDFGLDGNHMGVHRHTHFAETFIGEYRKYVN